MNSGADTAGTQTAEERDQFIPVRKSDILDALVEQGRLANMAERSGLVALGGFVMRQYLRYQRQSLKYQKELTDLDRKIEAWLRDKFQLDIDFEVEDALAKLERLGLLRRDGERLKMLPPDQALTRLDQVWDDYFQFNGTASTALLSDEKR